VPAPVHLGIEDQVKAGSLGFKNLLVSGGRLVANRIYGNGTDYLHITAATSTATTTGSGNKRSKGISIDASIGGNFGHIHGINLNVHRKEVIHGWHFSGNAGFSSDPNVLASFISLGYATRIQNNMDVGRIFIETKGREAKIVTQTDGVRSRTAFVTLKSLSDIDIRTVGTSSPITIQTRATSSPVTIDAWRSGVVINADKDGIELNADEVKFTNKLCNADGSKCASIDDLLKLVNP